MKRAKRWTVALGAALFVGAATASCVTYTSMTPLVPEAASGVWVMRQKTFMLLPIEDGEIYFCRKQGTNEAACVRAVEQ